jgi:hypothetical protein
MTCLFNARAYRDGSAAAPRRPDTSYWVALGWRGLVREHLGPRVQGGGLPRRGTTCVCRVCRWPSLLSTLNSERHRDLQSIHFSCAPAGPGVAPVVAPGASPARFLARAFEIQLAVAVLDYLYHPTPRKQSNNMYQVIFSCYITPVVINIRQRGSGVIGCW